MPIISVIYDAATGYTEFEDAYITVCDTGQEALEQISVEEYNSMQGVRIIPNSLAIKMDICLLLIQRHTRLLLKVLKTGMLEPIDLI